MIRRPVARFLLARELGKRLQACR